MTTPGAPGGPGFAAALSEHPVPAAAVGEVAGAVLEVRGVEPDLACVFVTPHHAGALEDIAGAIRTLLRPRVLLGCAAEGVIGGSREVEDGPGISLWVGDVGEVAPLHLELFTTSDGHVLSGWPDPLPFEPGVLVLCGDPYSFPAPAILAALQEQHPGLRIVGGMAGAGRGPGGTRLVLDGDVLTSGAVGVLLPAAAGDGSTVAVAQGCRPIGKPYVVTRSEGNLLVELAGRAPLEHLRELAGSLPEDEAARLRTGLHLGIVVDEHKTEFGTGDFLVRNVVGADSTTGAIRVGDVVPVGTTVQFHLRDAVAAHDDLVDVLGGLPLDGCGGTLLFTCNGRGVRLFGEPDHDAELVFEATGRAPVAGFVAAGEIGPVGRRSYLHGFTAAIAALPHRRSAT